MSSDDFMLIRKVDDKLIVTRETASSIDISANEVYSDPNRSSVRRDFPATHQGGHQALAYAYQQPTEYGISIDISANKEIFGDE